MAKKQKQIKTRDYQGPDRRVVPRRSTSRRRVDFVMTMLKYGLTVLVTMVFSLSGAYIALLAVATKDSVTKKDAIDYVERAVAPIYQMIDNDRSSIKVLQQQQQEDQKQRTEDHQLLVKNNELLEELKKTHQPQVVYRIYRPFDSTTVLKFKKARRTTK